MGARALDMLFIGGCDRSGSTLLAMMLGRIPGVCNLGELRGLWQRGLRLGRLCGCGVPVNCCEFWSRVLEEAFGSVRAVPLDEILRLRWRVDRMRRVPSLLARQRRGRFARDARAYRGVLAKVLAAARTVAGAEVLVDSTKSPSSPLVLAGVPGARVRVIHLVRDSRAVAHSLARRVVNPAAHDRTVLMPRRGTLNAGMYWTAMNLLTHLTSHRAGTVTFVRYEDLAARPLATMEGLLRTLGLPDLPKGLLEGSRLPFSTQHTVSGNPVRFNRGVIEIRPDTEWTTALPRWARLTVTAITWPLLRRYGYLGGGSAGDALVSSVPIGSDSP